MKVKSLYPIIVSENIEETIAFYKSLGFEQKHDAVTNLGTHVYVLQNGDLEMEVMESIHDGPVHITEGLYGLRMNVDDIEAAAETVKNSGATIIAGPMDTVMGKHLMIRDKQGINITLIQHIKK